MQPLLSAEQALTVTQDDRDHLEAFLDPKFGAPAAGANATPFRFVKAKACGSGRGSAMICSRIYVGRAQVTGGSHNSLHAALLHSLKVLIPDAGTAMNGAPEEEVRKAAVAYLEGRVIGMRDEAGEAGAAATSGSGSAAGASGQGGASGRSGASPAAAGRVPTVTGGGAARPSAPVSGQDPGLELGAVAVRLALDAASGTSGMQLSVGDSVFRGGWLCRW